MKIILETGVIVEPATDELAKQYLEYGGKEVAEKVTPKKEVKTDSKESK